jgi:hypothetical protein
MMSEPKNPIAWVGYFILGLVVLLVAVQILKGVLAVVYTIATLVLSLAIVAAIGWVVYLILKSAFGRK